MKASLLVVAVLLAGCGGGSSDSAGGGSAAAPAPSAPGAGVVTAATASFSGALSLLQQPEDGEPASLDAAMAMPDDGAEPQAVR
jgi:hypothetical protein